jgi:hypothetical protein
MIDLEWCEGFLKCSARAGINATDLGLPDKRYHLDLDPYPKRLDGA